MTKARAALASLLLVVIAVLSGLCLLFILATARGLLARWMREDPESTDVREQTRAFLAGQEKP